MVPNSRRCPSICCPLLISTLSPTHRLAHQSPLPSHQQSPEHCGPAHPPLPGHFSPLWPLVPFRCLWPAFH
ncbi:hypothetical protein niasHT_033914 [Heterodera trifolii]|uniref:Uncharacterized protein n=1 Tax=Heterodera trifolii TaxID=157864 RepID=A0ABD2HSK5_9BILA